MSKVLITCKRILEIEPMCYGDCISLELEDILIPHESLDALANLIADIDIDALKEVIKERENG